MNNIKKYLKVSATVLTGAIIASAFSALLFVSAPKAHAAISPVIVAGQDLKVGSSGPSVAVLQGLLSEMGYLNVPTGTSFGYYGSLTKAAVGKYQASINVAPTAGYYGPLTKLGMYSDFQSRGWLNLLGWSS